MGSGTDRRMTTNTRPLGVTALGALLVVAPLVGVLGLFALMVPGTPLDVLWSINPTGRAAFQQHPALVGVALGAIPLTAMAGAGLLLMSRWGRRLAMALLVTNAIGDTAMIPKEGARAAVGVIIVVALLTYLGRPRVREAFDEPSACRHSSKKEA